MRFRTFTFLLTLGFAALAYFVPRGPGARQKFDARTERAPAAASKKSATPLLQKNSEKIPDAALDLRAQLRALENCYETRNCGFPDSDPREHDLAVARAIATMADTLAHLPPSEANAALARELLGHDDGYVKAAALKVLAVQPPSSAALDAILSGVFGSHDEALVSDALKALERYRDPSDRARIAEALAEALRTGSVNVAAQLALELRRILDDTNLPLFASVARGLPADSRIRYLIENALSSYTLARQGG